jgi:hypothetical protein
MVAIPDLPGGVGYPQDKLSEQTTNLVTALTFYLESHSLQHPFQTSLHGVSLTTAPAIQCGC